MMQNRLTTAILAVALLAGTAPLALAAGTPSGTTITNSATLDYQVGGISQPPVASNAAQFLVDNRVDLTVTDLNGGYVLVVPGAVNMVLSYSATNTGNTVQDYNLVPQLVATDDFDATNVRVFWDSNGNGVYDPAGDTLDYIDELAPDATTTVFIVADIPAGVLDAEVADYDLFVQTGTGNTPGFQGILITTDDAGDADDPNAVQIVFADAAGTVDAPRDGEYSARNRYQAAAVDLTVTKTSAVVSDPINGAVNPKAIPGAVVGYTLAVANAGGSAGENVTVVDAVPASTAFVVASAATVPAGATVTYSNDGGLTWVYVPVAAGDGSDVNVTHLRVEFGSVAGGGSVQADFQVLIQ